MVKIFQFIKNHSGYFILSALIVASSFFYLHNLGNSYITLWDEAIHVNVVKNLANNCCKPTLHMQDLDTDYRDWSNNFVWLHKPLLPFYINAVFYKALGSTLFALRFPSFLFVELIGIVLFVWIKKYFNQFTALLTVALFFTNSYTFEQVQGRQFSGLSDILLCFLVLILLWLIFKIAFSPQRKYFIGFGLIAGLAYLTKSGLALVPFVPLGLVVLKQKQKSDFLNFFYAGLACIALVVPYQLLIHKLFPIESAYESKMQLDHLFKNIESWGRPLDYYFSFYFRQLTGPLLAGLGLLAIGCGVIKSKTDIKIFIITTTILAYLIPLSFGVSKIANFIYPIVPLLCILLSNIIVSWWQQKKYSLLGALGGSIIVSYILIQKLHIYGLDYLYANQFSLLWRFGAAFIGLAAFAIAFAIIKFAKILDNKKTAVILMATAGIIFFGFSLKTNWKSSTTKQPDYQQQFAAQETGKQLSTLLPPGSILITQIPNLEQAHLYLQYWSGFDAVDASRSHSINELVPLLSQKSNNLYLISGIENNKYKMVTRLPSGNLYLLK